MSITSALKANNLVVATVSAFYKIEYYLNKLEDDFNLDKTAFYKIDVKRLQV